MSETSSRNALDETEENGFDQRNVDEEENSFISSSYSARAGKKEITELVPEHVYHPFIHFRSWMESWCGVAYWANLVFSSYPESIA